MAFPRLVGFPRNQGKKGSSNLRKRVLMMFAVSCMAVMAVAGTAWAGGGNSGAAQSCQQGGYMSMTRADGSAFKNAGDCVSYFAQVNKAAACTFTSGFGCLTFDNVTVPGLENNDTLTLNSSFSFSTTACNAACTIPNAFATGGGTYTITDNSTGTVIESGTLNADNANSFQGLEDSSFTDASGNPTSCSAATVRQIELSASTANVTPTTNRTDSALQIIGVTVGGTSPVEATFVTTYSGLAFETSSSAPIGISTSC